MKTLIFCKNGPIFLSLLSNYLNLCLVILWTGVRWGSGVMKAQSLKWPLSWWILFTLLLSTIWFHFLSLVEVLVGGWSESVCPHWNSPQRAGARRPVQLQTVQIQEPLHQGLPHSSSQVSVCVLHLCLWAVTPPDCIQSLMPSFTMKTLWTDPVALFIHRSPSLPVRHITGFKQLFLNSGITWC